MAKDKKVLKKDLKNTKYANMSRSDLAKENKKLAKMEFDHRKAHFMIAADFYQLKTEHKLLKAVIYNLMKAFDSESLSMNMVDMGELKINIDDDKCDITRGLSFWEVDEDEVENED